MKQYFNLDILYTEKQYIDNCIKLKDNLSTAKDGTLFTSVINDMTFSVYNCKI